MCVMKNAKKLGFTLAELLVVVAIIAVLVAVSIPIFTAQIEKARAAADAANVRAAKAAATTDYLTNHNDGTAVTYYYDAENGRVSTDATAVFTGYGKSDSDIKTDNADGIPNNGTAGIVSVKIASEGTRASWVIAGGGTSGNSGLLGKLTASLTWSSIKGRITSDSGYTLPPGTLVSDGNRLFLVFGNQNWYSNKKAGNMADLAAANPSNIEEITASTALLPDSTVSGRTSAVTIAAGSIGFYNGKYYCTKEKISYNDWEKEKNPTTDSRWAQIR
jgi:prepilin-type N-terminal cleavage/methylation domain-containing protein